MKVYEVRTPKGLSVLLKTKKLAEKYRLCLIENGYDKPEIFVRKVFTEMKKGELR